MSLFLYLLYFTALLCVVLPNCRIFGRKHGRKHRLMGGWHLFWLLVGYVDCVFPIIDPTYYDILLGLSGLALTLTAASEFKENKLAKNTASGALDDNTTITHSEMIEHSFYQGLNLLQILYIHFLPASSLWARFVLLAIITSPWLVRSRFPVNHFSDNYTKGQDVWSLISVLYRIKKYQYVFYKHALLHGLNISLACTGTQIGALPFFRLYWLSLNTAYVMEFFLQTLVKKKLLAQNNMLCLNQLLMLSSTLPAIQVLWQGVWGWVCVLSLCLNLLRRGHDVANVALTAGAALAWQLKG